MFEDIWFKLYYGLSADTQYMISFTDDADETLELNIGYVENFMVICDAERHPTVGGAVVTVHEKVSEGTWEELEDDSVCQILQNS